MGLTAQFDAAMGLADRYVEVRRTTEQLCAPLSAEDQMVQSMPEASPAKWHQAHTTWFFETFVLIPHLAEYRPFDPEFQFLFNSYYKQVETRPLDKLGAGSPKTGHGGAPAHPFRGLRGVFSRPTLAEIVAYRQHVDEYVGRLMERGVAPEVEALIEVGTHHEQQHQELILTDIKHAFWSHPLRPAYSTRLRAAWSTADPVEELPLEWVPFRGGVVEVGYDGEGFAFDNECPVHDVVLEPYQLASQLITNGDFVEFIEDGGYSEPGLWLSDGWDRVCEEHWRAPLYWEETEDGWQELTLSGMMPVDAARPVCHVSYYEADAFARWAGARLPREEEWEHAAKKLPVAGCQLPVANLLDTGALHPLPAQTQGPYIVGAGQKKRPVHQMFGDAWEWTGSAYLGYPGYRPAEGAIGEYNGKFMSGQMVLRGGSCATPASHIRATYRNFFPPQTRWQFMGIRLAKDGD